MINVCYCGNRKIFPGLLLSVMSLAKHTERALSVYVLSMDLHEQNPAFVPFTQNQMNVLNEVLQEKNPESRAVLIDMTQHYTSYLAHGANKKGAIYTPYTLLRLYLDQLENVPDKIIYMDIDTMCIDDISKLWEIDISDYEYAAALDYMGRFWINKNYCNAGVLSLNLTVIRQSGLFEQARKLLYEKRLTMLDQAALNRLGKRVLYLPDRFNEQRNIKPDTVIKHFCKGTSFKYVIPICFNIKQWQREKVHKKLKLHCFDDLYEKYDLLEKKYDFSK